MEYDTNPKGVDTLNPRLSFALCGGPTDRAVKQTSYEINIYEVREV